MGVATPKELRTAPNMGWLRKQLLAWFSRNGRSFPWRSTHDPFHILIAEIMLRRTKGPQVQPVFLEVVQKYGEPALLANARIDEIESIIRPLGLPRRAKELVSVGQSLVAEHHGRVPQDRDSLKKLPGVGDYVAGAVLCLAFSKREWILDTNVVRVLRRFFGIPLRGELRRNRHMIGLARDYARSRSPRRAALAIIDLAASVCTPSRPQCGVCPLRKRCVTASIPPSLSFTSAPLFASA